MTSPARGLALSLALLAALASPLAAAPLAPWRSDEARREFEEGSRLADDGVYPFAIDRLQKAVALEPRAEIHKRLGECFDAIDQPVLAAARFADAAKLDPKDAESLNRLGCLEVKLERWDAAVVTFQKLSRLDRAVGQTGLKSAYLGKGAALMARKKYKEAAAAYRSAVAVSGADTRALEGLKRAERAGRR